MTVTKSEGKFGNFTARCYAYVPDPKKPSTWKLRLMAKPNDQNPDISYVGNSVGALSPGGLQGMGRVQIPMKDMAAVKAKVRAAWVKFHPGEEVPSAISNADDRIRKAVRKRR